MLPSNRLPVKLELRPRRQPSGPAAIGNGLPQTWASSALACFTGIDSQGKFRPDGPKEKLLSKNDVIVDEVRRVRDELVKKYGGLDGWIQHLQAMDRERGRKTHRRTAVKPRSKAGARRPIQAS